MFSVLQVLTVLLVAMAMALAQAPPDATVVKLHVLFRPEPCEDFFPPLFGEPS